MGKSRWRGAVMFIEEDRELCAIYEYVAQELGFRACVTSELDAAVRLARLGRPDVVFADVGLRAAGAAEVARALRATTPDAFVVAVTTCSAFGVETARSAGFDGALRKPFGLDELESELERGLVTMVLRRAARRLRAARGDGEYVWRGRGHHHSR